MSTNLVQSRRAPATLIVAFLVVEFADELVFGARNAAWPMIRAELGLTYEQIGILLTVPTVAGCLIEPAIGILGDTWRRRQLLVGGGVVFVISLALTALAQEWITLLAAFVAFNPASGAFVGLSQATLMDVAPERREQYMARWVVAGSVGVVAGASFAGILARVRGSWRIAFAALAIVSAGALTAVWHAGRGVVASPAATQSVTADLRSGTMAAVRTLRRAEVRRWLILLECADLMLDVLNAFLVLYLVDVAGATAAQGAWGVALFTGVGLAGDAVLVPLLERVDGLRYLRISVALTLVAFPAFLLAPTLTGKFALIAALGLLNTGWYSIPKARLYAAMPGQSAAVLTLSNVFGLVSAFVPLGIGMLAERFGLGPTMWILLAGPLAFVVGLPRHHASDGGK